MRKEIRNNFLQAIEILENTKQEEFNMLTFRTEPDKLKCLNGGVPFYSQHDCGTIGCALGIVAAKGKGTLRPYINDFVNGQLAFSIYVARFFPCYNKDDRKEHMGMQNAWRFLFHSDWYFHDNTPKGAAERMKYYLNNEQKIKSKKWEMGNFKTGWWNETNNNNLKLIA